LDTVNVDVEDALLVAGVAGEGADSGGVSWKEPLRLDPLDPTERGRAGTSPGDSDESVSGVGRCVAVASLAVRTIALPARLVVAAANCRCWIDDIAAA
jgi:hypothetical protein